LEPTIRYKRWEKDGGFPMLPTKASQVEFLISVALGGTAPDPARLSGHRMSLGVIAGISALGEFYPASGVRKRVGFLVGATQLELRPDGRSRWSRAVCRGGSFVPRYEQSSVQRDYPRTNANALELVVGVGF
jgi:hypothetical protein